MRSRTPDSYESDDNSYRSGSPSRSPARSPRSLTPGARITEEEMARLEEQRANIRDLPPFFPSRLSKIALLPLELVNEPFSFYDNKLRPEIVAPRPRFFFEIRDHGAAACTVGSTAIVSRAVDTYRLPKKRTTNVSVVTVYDTYGLEVAYSFMKHLYTHKYQDNRWLLTYLEGSLRVLWPESRTDLADNSPVRILYLCCQIMRELEYLETKLPKILAPVQPTTVTFPPEVLAKILRSERISTEVSSAVRHNRCRTMPTNPELEAEYIPDEVDERVILLDGETYILGWGSDNPWTLQRDDDLFIFTHWNEEVSIYASKGEVQTYPLYTYDAVFERRGCNGPQSVAWMLEDIAQRTRVVNESNIDLACSWLLQLSFELDESDSATFTMQELGQRLQVLIRTVIERMR